MSDVEARDPATQEAHCTRWGYLLLGLVHSLFTRADLPISGIQLKEAYFDYGFAGDSVQLFILLNPNETGSYGYGSPNYFYGFGESLIWR